MLNGLLFTSLDKAASVADWFDVVRFKFTIDITRPSVDGNLLELEIKDEHGEPGWLYSNTSIIVIGTKAITRTKLQEIAEEKLKDKVFTDEEPKANTLKRIDRAIIAWLDINDIPLQEL